MASTTWLRRALLEWTQRDDGYLYEGWAEVIRPPDIEVRDELAALLPDFSDQQLLDQPFSPEYKPPRTKPLPRAPAQPSRATPLFRNTEESESTIQNVRRVSVA